MIDFCLKGFPRKETMGNDTDDEDGLHGRHNIIVKAEMDIKTVERGYKINY